MLPRLSKAASAGSIGKGMISGTPSLKIVKMLSCFFVGSGGPYTSSIAPLTAIAISLSVKSRPPTLARAEATFRSTAKSMGDLAAPGDGLIGPTDVPGVVGVVGVTLGLG